MVLQAYIDAFKNQIRLDGKDPNLNKENGVKTDEEIEVFIEENKGHIVNLAIISQKEDELNRKEDREHPFLYEKEEWICEMMYPSLTISEIRRYE